MYYIIVLIRSCIIINGYVFNNDSYYSKLKKTYLPTIFSNLYFFTFLLFVFETTLLISFFNYIQQFFTNLYYKKICDKTPII